MNYSKRGLLTKIKSLNSKSTKIFRKILLAITQLVLLASLSAIIIMGAAGLGIFNGILATAPDISNVDVSPTSFSTFVYDTEGNQTAKLVASNSNRIPVGLDKIPQHLSDAFVSIEDDRFYQHNGIDIKGIIRAAMVGAKNKFKFSEGASTITQQLLKNSVFTEWTSETKFAEKLKRKIQEQYLAIELEKVMSKEDILVNYLNTINLGQNTLGVQAASLRYFNKNVYELNLSESAVLASITQNPSDFNPITQPAANAKRRTKVLDNMLKFGYIDQVQYDEAINDDVYSRISIVNEEVGETSTNTYFVDYLTEQVLDDLVNIVGYNDTQAFTLLYSGGLSIYSTQDPKIQSICDDIYANEENYPDGSKWLLSYDLSILKANGDTENHSSEMYQSYYKTIYPKFNLLYDSKEEAYAAIEEYKTFQLFEGDSVLAEKISLTPQPQVSLTVENQSNGHIVALVGGRGFKEGSRTLNRATSTVRQPGSTFKVLSTYAPALDSAGLTLATVQNDAPFNYANGRPVSNWYGQSYRGLNSLRQGIVSSLNIVAVKTLTQITPQLGFDYLLNFGLTTVIASEEINGQIFTDIQQSTALGGITHGVTNLELNAAYATIANGGTYIKPKLYTKIVDYNGNVIIDNTEPVSHQVIKETTAFLLTDAMVGVVTGGTGSAVNFGGMSIAGKTGTTSDNNDVWFCGYTPYYTATTWAGFDNNTKLRGAEISLAKKLWKTVMSEIHTNLENQPFTKPAGIVSATVCSRSGKLPIPGLCDATLKSEYFADGTVPTATCNVHYSGALCAYCGLPATEMCPFPVPGTVELLPPEHELIQSGSSITPPPNPDGSPSPSYTMCPHDATFFANPDYENIINAQRAEMQAAAIAAAAAAAAPPPEGGQ